MDVAVVLLVVVIAALMLGAGMLVGRYRAEAAGRAAVARAEAAGRDAAAQAEAAGRDAAARAEAAGRDAVTRAQGETHAARTEVARLTAVLESERAAARERADADVSTEARIREAFDSLAGQALERNNQAFAQLAEARLATAKEGADGELAKRQIAIEALVTPLRDSLAKVEQQLNAVERDRAGSYAGLLEQIGSMRQTNEQLRTETHQLVTALRAPQVRGAWGEMQLRRTVEAAGMTEHIDFVEQHTVQGDDGRLRPDMVVQLVGGKNVVVDSKVAFSGYLEAMEARDDATRAARFKAHARHLRTHVDQLAAKGYHQHVTPSPEFVVCFVPADAFLDAALREDPTLQERAFDQNVVLATPSTLVALLRTIAYTWRQEALASNAAEVHRLGRELYGRLSTMGKHFDKLGRSLNGAVGAYNDAVASVESRVFVTARRMVDLKVVEPTDELIAPRQVTETTRTVQAEEIAGQRLVTLPKASRVPAGQDELPVTQDAQRATS
ncbi:DNA recombination protein RmuC [Jatrophihabitans endophyticus]|uniref:DNA recombination protein RmuC n=1 Tax=Jatrophihabitans endophyticus TaxID=1206085 RepID=A0A1M5T478_9ACTN|nr:DNA recombination protein RmuC [Jatrophihabitans endophyticus]SHH45539.1 DNA recombination protein RmuC [Jatrophihabitans endophyticus]